MEIAKLYPTKAGKKTDRVILANELDYPDGMTAVPLVCSMNAALLLTRPNQLPEETRNYICDENIKNIIILGGVSAVSPQVVQELLFFCCLTI